MHILRVAACCTVLILNGNLPTSAAPQDGAPDPLSRDEGIIKVSMPQNLEAPYPQRVFEIGLVGGYGYEAHIAQLDHVLEKLKAARDLKLYLVSFGEAHGMPGEQFRLANMCWNYIVKTRGFAQERVMRLHAQGGVGTRVEVWIGARAPEVRSFDVPDVSQTRMPLRFDSYSSAFSGELSWVEEEDVEARLGTLAAVLKANPRLGADVEGFAGTAKGFMGERVSGMTLAQREVNTLVERFGIERGRLRAKNGGRRQTAAIDLWLRPAASSK